MNRFTGWVAGVLFFAAAGLADAAPSDRISLAGEWKFQLDGENVGVEQQWFNRNLDDTITLPGTTDSNKKGTFKDEKAIDRLSRVWYWKGAAWYQREVVIPEGWSGKRITLFLERTKHTQVWVDGTFRGWDNSLSAPHVFDLTDVLPPGKHTLTILVDNARMPPVGPSHAVDERTQTNWNGLIGKLELRATDRVWIEDIQVFPNAAKKQAKVRATLGNLTGRPASGQLKVSCKSVNVKESAAFKTQTVKVNVGEEERVIEFTYAPGDNVPLWDEFNPVLLQLDLLLETGAGDEKYQDHRSARFGMRDFGRVRNQFVNNGKTVFLRGRIDCCFYPLTGFPPMDKESWRKILSTLKSYGLNHARYHSWFPPKAAFEAADELGMYFQPEFPNKRSGFNAPESEEAAFHNIDRLNVETTETKVSLYDYAIRESDMVFRHFGNHPSFALYTLGNEMGRRKAMFDLVARFKSIDPRRLYAQGSNCVHWNPHLAEGDEFWVTGRTAKHLPLRGSYAFGSGVTPHIEYRPPSTMVDYLESISGLPVPAIGHENGQFQVYPDYRDIPKFTGVVRARNYEAFRERLREAGMLDQAQDFVDASGALSAICYREDVEAALRTPGLGGFQLLDIQDFPGQGTALVGMLNVFMESKGIIEPEDWRRFCSETVPLLRMKKYTWTTDETFLGRVQVAHYGPEDIPDARVTWTVTDSYGVHIANGAFDPVTIPQGKVFEVDLFSVPLREVVTPTKLKIELAIKGTDYRNHYPIWVYPSNVALMAPKNVFVARRFTDEATRQRLKQGAAVLLFPHLDELPHSVQGAFQTEFWSPMFAASARRRGKPEPPGTLGILCDPKTPALAEFPTEFHSNWQWWQLTKNSRPIVLDDTPDEYRPVIQVVDNFVRNHKLGLLAETKVGSGKLLICSIDLPALQKFPEGRQLLYSLIRYVGSANFAPKATLSPELLEKLLPGKAQEKE